MYNRKINGFIIEGADQQGKTHLANKLKSKGYNVFHFGIPDKDFDFYNSYIEPFRDKGYNVYDRSFVSEIVYSKVLNRKTRVDKFNELVRFFKDSGFVFIFLERSKYTWENREEEYCESKNRLFIDEYRRVFSTIDCEKYYIDPEVDELFVTDLIDNRFSNK